MSKTNRDVLCAFLNHSEARSNNGNCHSTGSTLWSYWTPVAVWHGNVILETSDTYSATTSARHTLARAGQTFFNMTMGEYVGGGAFEDNCGRDPATATAKHFRVPYISVNSDGRYDRPNAFRARTGRSITAAEMHVENAAFLLRQWELECERIKRARVNKSTGRADNLLREYRDYVETFKVDNMPLSRGAVAMRGDSAVA